jgi:two-component system, OmpR family, phosphate regulon response regulator PhoB
VNEYPAPLLLVVEDDEPSRSRIELHLQRRGYKVVTAGTGAETLEKIRREHPELVLFDLTLPDRDAFDVALEVRRDPAISDTLIIMMHSPPSFEDFCRAHQVGLDCLLTKPIDLEEMVRLIRRIFDSIGRPLD